MFSIHFSSHPLALWFPHEHYTLPKYRRPETSDTCYPHYTLPLPCCHPWPHPAVKDISTTFHPMRSRHHPIISLGRYAASRLALASLGSLTLVMPQPLGFTLHLMHSATFTSVITLCQWAGVTQHTPVHHPKNPILGFFWMAKLRTLFTGVRIFSTYSRLSPTVCPSYLLPTYISLLPTLSHLPPFHLPSPSFTLNTTLPPLLLLWPPLHHLHLSSFFHFAINNKKLCCCQQLCRY